MNEENGCKEKPGWSGRPWILHLMLSPRGTSDSDNGIILSNLGNKGAWSSLGLIDKKHLYI